jgi:hypothetical protein
MPPAPFPDFRWFFRIVRVLPVVAVAALAGGIIGGFSVFAIDLALTAPPNHGSPAEPGSKLASKAVNNNVAASPAPMRTFDPATPTVAAAASPTPAPAPAAPMPAGSVPAPGSGHDVSPAQPVAAAKTSTQSAATNEAITVVHPQTTLSAEQSQGTVAVAPSARTSWPDALSREHNAAPSETPAPAPQIVNQAVTPAASRPQAVEAASAATAPQPATVQTPQKPETKAQTIKRRVAIKRPRPPNERADETSSDNARPLYDDYSRHEGRQDEADRAEHRAARPQYSERRAPPVDIERSSDRTDGPLYDRSDDRGDDDNGDALPAQPPPPPAPLPFFGLFGGGNN